MLHSTYTPDMDDLMKKYRNVPVFIVIGAIVLWAFTVYLGFYQPSYSATKTVTCPADGKFHIVQSIICDPEGKPFLPRGINEFAGTTFGGFNSNIANEQTANTYVNGWNFNFLRIVTCPNGSCLSHEQFGGQTVQGDSLDSVIQTYTSKKVVVMLDYHGLPYPNPPSQSDIDIAAAWFKQMAVQYKDNPYVWLESFNEPIDGNDGMQTWANFSGQIIDAVRSVNPDKIVVICSGNYGQDSTGNGDSFDQAGSHILNAGSGLAAKGNVLFDIHFYSRWANVSVQGAKNYFQALHDAGFAFLIGETWGDPGGQQFMQMDQQATDTLYAAKPNGVGIAPWSAAGNYPGVNGGRAPDINSLTSPSNLTHNGQLQWDWSHNPPSAVPDGYTVSTGGPTNNPSPTDTPPVTIPSNTPPATCPLKSQGDANCDGKITILDFAVWRAEFLGTLTTKNADFDGDGQVRLADFAIWRNSFLTQSALK